MSDFIGASHFSQHGPFQWAASSIAALSQDRRLRRRSSDSSSNGSEQCSWFGLKCGWELEYSWPCAKIVCRSAPAAKWGGRLVPFWASGWSDCAGWAGGGIIAFPAGTVYNHTKSRSPARSPRACARAGLVAWMSSIRMDEFDLSLPSPTPTQRRSRCRRSGRLSPIRRGIVR